MSRRRALSDEERALWTGVARSITPLRRSRQPAAASAAEVGGGETFSVPSPAAAPPAAPPEKKPPPLAPLGRRLKQRVGRGRAGIDARLDLHGFTQTEAHGAVALPAPRPSGRLQNCTRRHRQGNQQGRTRRRDRARRAQATGADVAFAARISPSCRRFRGCPRRPWRARRALRAVATISIGR